MSQTLQSIHSLSIQLNRAASMQDHLNEICHSPLERGDQAPVQLADAPQGSSQRQQVTGRLSQLVSKKARRVKEMLLQNIGKADKTRDELFQVYESNFYRQQEHALKLHKEFKSYLESLEASQGAGKSLSRCIQQATGDYQCARHDLVCENLSQLEHLNEDLLDKLRAQVLLGLGEYLSQFGEMRNKIAKRRRKLIDYDSSRRHYEQTLAAINKRRQQKQELESTGATGSAGLTIQSATSQLVEEARLLKLREQFNYCKVMYEAINSELHEQLPLVYEKKMKNLLMSLQNYFSLEAQFHSNVLKLYATAGEVIDELPMSLRQMKQQQQQAKHDVEVQRIKLGRPAIDDANHSDEDYSQAQVAAGSSSSGMGSSRADSSPSSSSSCSPAGICSPVESETQASDDNELMAGARNSELTQEEELEEEPLDEAPQSKSEQEATVCEQPEASQEKKPQAQNAVVEMMSSPTGDKHLDKTVGLLKPVHEEAPAVPEEELPQQPSTSGLTQPEEAPQPAASLEPGQQLPVKGFLYKVRSIFKYLAEDVDELCFEEDEIIQVVEQDESQEPEEGWLVGVRELNGQRGLFPANFTHPI